MRPNPREGYTVFDRVKDQDSCIARLKNENSSLKQQLENAQRELKQKERAIAVLDENYTRLKESFEKLQELTNKQKAEPAKNPGIDLGKFFNKPKSQPQNTSTLPEKKEASTATNSSSISASKGTNTDEDDVIFTQNFPI